MIYLSLRLPLSTPNEAKERVLLWTASWTSKKNMGALTQPLLSCSSFNRKGATEITLTKVHQATGKSTQLVCCWRAETMGLGQVGLKRSSDYCKLPLWQSLIVDAGAKHQQGAEGETLRGPAQGTWQWHCHAGKRQVSPFARADESLCVPPASSTCLYLPDTRSTLYILSSLFLCHPVSPDWCCSRSKEWCEGAASREQFGHSLEPCRLPGQPLQCLLTPWEPPALCAWWLWWHSSWAAPFITTSSMLSFSWSDSIGLSPEIV